MFGQLKRLLTKTLYRQLVTGVTLLMAVSMSLFSWEMLRQQEATEVTQLTRQALALASSVANSSDIWVASRDFSGLQEIVLGLVGYPDLRHAMVLDSRGQVLAHSDPSRRGKYLTDLPAPVEPRILWQDQQQIDVVTPIMLADRHVGWARIGLGRAIFNAQFAKTRRDAVLYSLLTISLGALFAALAVRYLTRRLRAVQQVADAVPAGQLDRRAAVTGHDEAAQLASHFNAMLDRLAAREEALKESETLLNATQQLGKIGGWQWDIQKQTMTWTPETYRIHDMVPEPAASTGVSDHIVKSIACYLPQDRDAIMKAFWRCVEQGEPYDIEVRFITVKNRPLWVRTMAQAVRHDGQIVKVLGYIMDITERKQLEQLNRSAALYTRTLLEASLDPLVTINAEGKITDANRATELATGVSRDHLIATDFASYFTSPDQARASYRQAFSQGFVTNYPLAIQHVSGKVTEVIYNASVYHGEDGSILGIFAAARDITDLKKMEEEIRQLAFFDPLTQLPNRRMFTDRLSQAMVASQRNGSFGALIYLDLDNFKPVNDHFGHAAGDLLLIEVAARLTSCVRAVDTVGRTGGDEFVVILGDLNADPAQAAAEASQIAGGILMALSHPYHLALPQQGRETMHVQHRCTASMGVSLFLGQQASQQDIMKWGDAAMYQAKQAGGNRVQFHQPVAAQPAPEIFSTHHGS
jgi:diguanylate cyclase (GGDEF)-like protein/PAS domain S-box-containing protein